MNIPAQSGSNTDNVEAKHISFLFKVTEERFLAFRLSISCLSLSLWGFIISGPRLGCAAIPGVRQILTGIVLPTPAPARRY